MKFSLLQSTLRKKIILFEFFSMSKNEIPSICLIKLEDMVKYKPPTNDLRPEADKSFSENLMAGRILLYMYILKQQNMLTQELKDDWDMNPVKVIVFSKFDEVPW